jgi:hypothetical protein
MSFEVSLSPGQARTLALALAAVPALAALAFAAALALSWSQHHQRMAALVAERNAYRRSEAALPALDKAVAWLDAAKARSGYFFASSQSTAAAAKMRSDIGAIVERDGATIARDEVELMAAGEDSPVELRATVSFTGDAKSLTRILYDLRRVKPLILVSQLVVHSEAGAAPLIAPNRLQVDLVGEAYLDTP